MKTTRTLSIGAFLAIATTACMPAPQQAPAEAPPPPPPPYQANWTYTASPAAEKLDVTLGIVAPQFSSGSELYQQANRTDATVQAMLTAMNATFGEVLSAKGFSITGPFDSFDEMTFPDKQGSDLVLIPTFDFQVSVETRNVRSKPVDSPNGGPTTRLIPTVLTTSSGQEAPPPAVQVCDAVVSVQGLIKFVAMEPLSQQSMWIKKIELQQADQTFAGQEGEACDGTREHWSRDVQDAWVKAHETVFQSGMKMFDTYVNGEEFKRFKAQAAEAREKTSFSGN